MSGIPENALRFPGSERPCSFQTRKMARKYIPDGKEHLVDIVCTGAKSNRRWWVVKKTPHGESMKIAMTIEVSDAARVHIAQLAEGETLSSGMATREAVIEYLKAHVARLDRDGAMLPTGKLSEDEAKDAELAVQYLRKQGKSDGQIRAWLLLQKARLAEPMRAAG